MTANMKPDRTPRVPPRTPGHNYRLATNSATPAPTPRLPRFKSRDPDTESASSSRSSLSGSDEVSVFCRLRPLVSSHAEAEASVQCVDEQTVRLVPPETSRAYNTGRQTQYSFKKVFDGDRANSDVFQGVAMPLVKDLLQDKNGLLFTYGVTGSGKTHTMQGTPTDGGIMARAIDVIFNSLEERLVMRKYMILPDGFNDFEPRTVADAAVHEQQEMIKGRTAGAGGYGRMNSDNNAAAGRASSNRVPDPTVIDEVVDANRTYAVFISYCEIYNSFIYDLLEDTRDPITGRPKYDSKILREDSYGNMYVHRCTELEVRSPKEALDAFYRGQKRRRVAQTQLNHESSRSHAIFNIRLVKTAPAGDGEIDCNQPIMVSQLALVDLAGSERCKRTGNTDKALKEAGKINNSLMNLRRCIEKLRENQKSGKNGAVPYRDDRLTHLFRNYFEGIGSVKMIVCVNPRQADFDENVNVMQFAEMASEVHIERVDPVPRELRLTPGQKKAKQAIQEALRKASSKTDLGAGGNPSYSPIYSLGPEWPNIDKMVGLDDDDDDNILDSLVPFLERRIATRNTLVSDHKSKLEDFRSRLVGTEQELILCREENGNLKTVGESQEKRVKDLEGRLVNAEAANNSLSRKISAFDNARVHLENELDEKELQLHQQKKDGKRTAKKFRQHLVQQEQVNNELAVRLKEQQAKAEKDQENHAKLNAVRNIINQDQFTAPPSTSGLSEGKRATATTSATQVDALPRRSTAVSNPRPRRSRSVGGVTIDHRPAQQPVPLNTVMQPNIPKRRSVTKLTEKDIMDKKVSNYCLTTQGQDTDGEVETKVYQGDVIPTTTGGKQVVFDNVDVLRQESPTGKSPRKTRSSSKRSFEDYVGVSNRIAALEDKFSKRPRV